jgi:hypothetical protein
VWEGPVAEQPHVYVRPQETAGRAHTRWMVLSDRAGADGLFVVAVAPAVAPAGGAAVGSFELGTPGVIMRC